MIAVKNAIGYKCVQRTVHSDASVCVQINRNLLNYEKDWRHMTHRTLADTLILVSLMI